MTHKQQRNWTNRAACFLAGLFGGEDGLVLEHQLFIDRKPGYYAFANDTENLTGEEVFAKFAPPG